jgi:hypothetical protein
LFSSFFWLILRRLNFIFRRFETLCSILIGLVKKRRNWDEIARVFLQVKVWLKKKSGPIGRRRDEERAWPYRGTGCEGQRPQVEVFSKTRM